MNKKYQEYLACKPEIQTIFTGEITSGMPYQRDVKNKQVKKIIENFDVHLFEPPIVTKNDDGSYKLVDGQHRISALIQMNDNRHCMAHCIVFNDMDGAHYIANSDKASTPLTPHDRIVAKSYSQHESDCPQDNAAFLNANKDICVRLCTNDDYDGVRFSCVTRLYQLFIYFGEVRYKEVMRLIAECSKRNAGVKDGIFIETAFKFCDKHNGKYDKSRFVSVFSVFDVPIRKELAKRSGMKVVNVLLQDMEEEYNKGLRVNKL